MPACDIGWPYLARFSAVSGTGPLVSVLLVIDVPVALSVAVTDVEAAMPLLDAIVQRSKTEDNCLYTGWTRSGDTLVLREAFGSVIGIARHVENIGEQLQALTAGPNPAATLLETRLHSALGNLQTFDDYCTDTKREVGYCSRATRRYYLEGGFSRYEVQQSMFGFFLRR